jgi:hypothetical protein
MLVCFKSTAAAEIIMYKEHIAAILEMLGKEVERGVITAAETPMVIQKIENFIEEEKKQAALKAKLLADVDEDEDLDSVEKKKKMEVVSLSARLFPFLDMLRAANKKQKDVLWGV